MTLNPSQLTSDLESVLGAGGTAAEVAEALADAYTAYASDGAFGASVPTIPPSATGGLAAFLLAAIADPATGSPASFGDAWSAGLAAYWVGVPVAGGAGAGTTAGCPGAGAAGGPITSTVANTANTAAAAAGGIGAALDVATKTVTAALGPPTNGSLPIT